MVTATDEKQRCLLDKPQPLGILPTRWFWNDRENWRLAGWAFATLAAATNIVLLFIKPSPVIGGALAFAVMLLANGLLEKYIRHRAVKRRRQLATRADPSLRPSRSCVHSPYAVATGASTRSWSTSRSTRTATRSA